MRGRERRKIGTNEELDKENEKKSIATTEKEKEREKKTLRYC